jgi:hypothetical protein
MKNNQQLELFAVVHKDFRKPSSKKEVHLSRKKAENYFKNVCKYNSNFIINR